MVPVGDLVVGRYRLVQHLGSGGMGQVWLAEDELLGRKVAIKQLLLDASAHTQEHVDRAVREARLAGRLSSPYAVAVHDLVMDGDQPMLVMEYVEGRTLAQVLRDRSRLPVEEAAAIMGQIASAVATAHELGIVHRDIKPANILVKADGRALLADFGIARSGADATLTATGAMIGTIAFMAPEVAAGEVAGPPSDAWSLGATLYTLVEGAVPFEGANPVDAIMRLARDPVPLPTHAGRLTDLITGLMNRDAAARTTVREAATALLAPRTAEQNIIKPAVEHADTVLRSSLPVAELGRPKASLGQETPGEPEGLPAPVGTAPTRVSRRRRHSSLISFAVLVVVAVVVVPLVVVLANNGDVPAGTPQPSAADAGLADPWADAARGLPALVGARLRGRHVPAGQDVQTAQCLLGDLGLTGQSWVESEGLVGCTARGSNGPTVLAAKWTTMPRSVRNDLRPVPEASSIRGGATRAYVQDAECIASFKPDAQNIVIFVGMFHAANGARGTSIHPCVKILRRSVPIAVRALSAAAP